MQAMLEHHRARAPDVPKYQRTIRTLPGGVALVLANERPWKPPVICGLIPADAPTATRQAAIVDWLDTGTVSPEADDRDRFL